MFGNLGQAKKYLGQAAKMYELGVHGDDDDGGRSSGHESLRGLVRYLMSQVVGPDTR